MTAILTRSRVARAGAESLAARRAAADGADARRVATAELECPVDRGHQRPADRDDDDFEGNHLLGALPGVRRAVVEIAHHASPCLLSMNEERSKLSGHPVSCA